MTVQRYRDKRWEGGAIIHICIDKCYTPRCELRCYVPPHRRSWSRLVLRREFNRDAVSSSAVRLLPKACTLSTT